MAGIKFTSSDIPDLSGQVIIVSRVNVGLGLKTIKQLRRHKPKKIYLAARSEEKAKTAIDQLKESDPSGSTICFLKLGLSSFTSVKCAVKTLLNIESRLDILVNNAGIMMTPEGLTEDGYEIQFGTNVLGPALFAELLLPLVQRTAKINPQARVVMLSSTLENVAPSDIYQFEELKTTIPHRNTTARYTQSKLAVIHYASAMAERHSDVKIISVYPGMVSTNLGQLVLLGKGRRLARITTYRKKCTYGFKSNLHPIYEAHVLSLLWSIKDRDREQA